MSNQDRVLIFSKANDEIVDLALSIYPHEACGILFGHKDNLMITRVLPVRNSAKEEFRNDYFEIDPLEMYKAEKFAESDGMDIIGFFHSHTDRPAILSKEDENHMIPEMLYLIGAVVIDSIEDLRCYIRVTPDSESYEIIIEEDGVL